MNKTIMDNNLCNYLYHKEFGFPKSIEIPEITVTLHHSDHALLRTMERVNPGFISPKKAFIGLKTLEEIHSNDETSIEKVILKLNYSKDKDLIMVLRPHLHRKRARVVTLWLRKKSSKTISNPEKYSNYMSTENKLHVL